MDKEGIKKLGIELMKFKRVLVFGVAFCLLSFFTLGNSFAFSSGECLERLEGIEVLVEEVKAELENYNLTAIQIQTDVEAQLHEAGIKVLSKEENEKIQPLRKPYLYIRIDSSKLPWKREVIAYSVEIALKQLVTLPAQPKSARKPFYAPTWDKSIVGAATPREFSEIRNGVQQLMDKFIKAYLAANPKP